MLTRHVYDVALNLPDGYAEHRTTVTAGDRLRAEFEAAKQKLPEVRLAPQNHTAVWLWCALTRAGVVAVDYQTFRHEVLLEFDVAKDDTGKPIEESPDPTQPAPSGSLSLSPPATAADPPTGSTPTSTTD